MEKIELSEKGFLLTTPEKKWECTHVVCATGARAHSLVARSDLANENGFLLVNEFLQSASSPQIFGAGDCVHFSPRNGLAKSGVYAVRAAPFLHANLQSALKGSPLKPFRPQKRFLRLLNTGNGSALAEWGPFYARGNWAWRWKDRIDKRFLAMYRMEKSPEAEPDCGGCGSKAAADIVCELRGNPGNSSRGAGTISTGKTIWGTDSAEDVALWKSGPDSCIAISLDQFRNFHADPFLFGRITAIASASDLYAKGIAPEAALMSLTIPKLSSRLAKDWARELKRGVESVFIPEGVEILGGHTTEGEEWNLGFSIWGSVSRNPWPKRGGKAGDSLILTKPLGTGILLTAHMQGVHLGEALSQCFGQMASSPREAWAILQDKKIHAATDVTGFSLLGHLSEMLEGTNLLAEINLQQIPLYPRAMELFQKGYRSRMHELNRKAYPAEISAPGAEILYDPQTSGGFLIAVPSVEAETLSSMLGASIIGRLAACSKEQIRVLP